MTHRFAPLPDALGPAFTRSEATELGVSSRRLQRPDVERIASALYRRRHASRRTSAGGGDGRGEGRGDPHPAQQWCEEHLERLLACRGRLPEQSFLIGRSAAVLWGFPVPPAHDHTIEIARLAPLRAPRRSGFSARQLSPHLVRLERRRGILVTDPATTWAMLAPSLGLYGAVALGDAVIRRARIPGTDRLERPPHARLEQLQAAILVGRRVGAPLLRKALPLLATSSASPPESHLRLRLREWNAPAPTLDHDVRDGQGRLIGCSEIAYPQIRLALEYEGDHHRTKVAQWNRDIEKYQRYRQNRWEVIRVTGELLYRRDRELRAQTFEAFERLGWPGL